METFPQPEKRENYSAMANELDKLQSVENQGRGIEHVRWIVDDLRKGDLDAAKTNAANQSDKFSQYPAVEEFLKRKGIIEEINWDKELDAE